MLPRPTPDTPGPGQTSVWSYPRPAVARPSTRHLRVIFAGTVIAETRAGFAVLETSHPPGYYIPPEDVDFSRLHATGGASSLCEWKGAARYYDIIVGDRISHEAAWTYPDPVDAFAPLKDHIAFYPGRVDACTVDGEAVTPQAGRFYGGWITSDQAGPFKGPPGTQFW